MPLVGKIKEIKICNNISLHISVGKIKETKIWNYNPLHT